MRKAKGDVLISRKRSRAEYQPSIYCTDCAESGLICSHARSTVRAAILQPSTRTGKQGMP